MERINKRVERDDFMAIHILGGAYNRGVHGAPQDSEKAMELWLRAGELGCAIAYGSIADSYREGQGVERDMAKSKYNAELAAMGGHVIARHNLGCKEAMQATLTER
jgi:TPR repeat protein